VLRPLNRKSELFVGNGVLTCKQLISLMIEYECPALTSAARTVVPMLKVLQYKCLRVLWVPPRLIVEADFRESRYSASCREHQSRDYEL